MPLYTGGTLHRLIDTNHDAQIPGQDAKALLLRYARKSQSAKGVFYNCRK